MSATFIETPRFPDELAAWATGGRGFKTDIVETYGGQEFRNASWSQARGEWEVQNAWRSANQTNNLHNQYVAMQFFMSCMGQLTGFRFKWYWDYTDTQNNGTGTVALIDATHYQATKTYTTGSTTYVQNIVKPVVGQFTVVGSGVYTVDTTTGIITVSSGAAPTGWTGQYDIPCRFAEDVPDLGLDESSGALLNWQQLKIIEIRDFS
jgi:uncharacterized protein (TIGR02217 family)